MAALDPRIEVIRERYGLDKSDFWELPQKKGTWVAKHSALEVAAVKAQIQFDNPTIIEANSEAGIAVICVAASMYERVPGQAEDGGVKRELRREWATGEASPKNNKNAYPWAMAEKRAKDRVILKLIGIHGLVYSEDELSDAEPEAKPRAQTRDVYAEMQAELDACSTLEELSMLWASKPFKAEFATLNHGWQEKLVERKDELKELLSAPAPGRARVPPNFEGIQQ